MIKQIVLVLFLSLLNKQAQLQIQADSKCLDKLTIQTKSGKVKGTCSFVHLNDFDENNQTRSDFVYSWLSIPFAEPPINENRFKAPKPVRPWPNILDASRIPNSCMQLINTNISEKLEFLNMWQMSKNSSSKISEDCLYLNIYASSNALNNQDKKQPVIVFFHGGHDGTMGSSVLDIYNPSVFVALTDILVVTFNYRLDIFGFLHIKEVNEIIEGNQGFLDQHLALKWINENIEKFGGDPNKVTLMGSEAGAKFIGYHLLFKPSGAYFRNVILQSGSPVNLGKNALPAQAANLRARAFAKDVLGCKQGKFISCIKKLDAYNLTLANRFFLRKTMAKGDFLTSLNLQTAFGPIVDGKLFKESPIRAFRLENFKKCNVLIGFNNNEGSSSIPFKFGLINDLNLIKNSSSGNQVVNFSQLVEFLKNFYNFYPTWPYNNSEIILNSILHEYTKLTSKNYEGSFLLKQNYFHTLSKIITDESYSCPVLKLANYIAKRSKVFLYNFNKRISNSKWPKWYGVTHGDELAMVFGHPLNDEKNFRNSVSFNPWTFDLFDKKDKEISKEIILRWSNFARYDNPNGKEGLKEIWPQYFLPSNGGELDSQNNKSVSKYFQHFSIQHESIQAIRVPSLDKCFFWNSLIPANLDVLAEMKRSSNS